MRDIVHRLEHTNSLDHPGLLKDAAREIKRLRAKTYRPTVRCSVCGQVPQALAAKRTDDGAVFFCYPDCWESEQEAHRG